MNKLYLVSFTALIWASTGLGSTLAGHGSAYGWSAEQACQSAGSMASIGLSCAHPDGEPSCTYSTVYNMWNNTYQCDASCILVCNDN